MLLQLPFPLTYFLLPLTYGSLGWFGLDVNRFDWDPNDGLVEWGNSILLIFPGVVNMPSFVLVERAACFGTEIAVIDDLGSHSYNDLLDSSARLATGLLDGNLDLKQARVAFLVPPSFEYVVTQWGIWRAGGIAVPLAVSHPRAELEYTIEDADVSVIVAHPEFREKLWPIADERGLQLILTTELLSNEVSHLPDVSVKRAATILYTSGSTGNPKGVVTTHAAIQSQVTTLVEAWDWKPDDHILNVLPLHHVHGIINAMTCAFWVGATCEIQASFEPGRVWDRLASGDLTLFMAVPTTYKALIQQWESVGVDRQRSLSDGVSRLRLMVSGSDALLVRTLERWKEITSHVLLERYGMTEIGMALSNPLNGDRIPGHVGHPLPGVEVRLSALEIDEETGRHIHGGPVEPGSPGEIQVRGPSVFHEYWRREEDTSEAFSQDGWFCSGDVASLEPLGYRIWGRASQDIIITGGENVSAKEVEQVLSTHPSILSCAVVGVQDTYWGKAVSVAVVVVEGESITRDLIRGWARDKLAPYKLPQRVKIVKSLPMNSMGKLIKPKVVEMFKSDSEKLQ